MDVLALSQATSQSLAQLDDLAEGTIVKICKHVLQKLLVGSSTIALDEKASATVDAVATVFLDAAKSRASDSSFRALLQEQGLRTEVIDLLAAFYQQQHDTIQTHLLKTGIVFTQVVGIDWRLDYDIKSRHAGKDGLPVFYVTLQVVPSNSASSTALSTGSVPAISTISFTASLEELQDLLAKVRDAVKEVDRVLAHNNSN